jgi:hypothetical protein
MLRLALSILLLTTTALAQGRPPDRRCLHSDQLGIADAGIGRAIVTYYNHVSACSRSVDLVLRSRAGIEVRVVITIGSRTDGFRETITLTPLDPQMMALPAEGRLLDGESGAFLIQGGGS